MTESIVTVTDELDIPVKDDFTGDIPGSIALGSQERIKIKGSDNVAREVANVIDIALKTSIAQIRLFTDPPPADLCYTTDPGKEGFWKYDALDAISIDNGIDVLSIVGGKTFKRVHQETLPITLVSGDQDTISSQALGAIVERSNETGLKISLSEEIKALPTNTDLLDHQVVGTGKIHYKGAVVYKEDMPLIGIPHNIDEKKVAQSSTTPISDGNILPAPMAEPLAGKGINVLAHWYNDFGLQQDLVSGNNKVWYDWRWNFTVQSEYYNDYDPSRHPLLGWYRGDDANVLDWQCYWLAKYGINGVIITNTVTEGSFGNVPSKRNYWVYQLFNNVKNFKNLQYVMWLSYKADTLTEMNAQQEWLINSIYGVYKNFSTHRVNNKVYPVFFIFDLEAMRGEYDNFNGVTNTSARLLLLNDMVKALGYDGMCIICRNLGGPTVWSENRLASFKAAGLILLSGNYTKNYGGTYSQYSAYANDMPLPTGKRDVVSLMTSAETVAPHPSNYSYANSTPEAFANLVNRTVDHIATHNLPRIFTVYNVAEWAEGGPGLQPNQRDGFGYLEAISGMRSLPPEKTEVLPFVSVSSGTAPNAAFLNSTYPIVDFPIGTTVSYYNLGYEYKRISNGTWVNNAITIIS